MKELEIIEVKTVGELIELLNKYSSGTEVGVDYNVGILINEMDRGSDVMLNFMYDA